MNPVPLVMMVSVLPNRSLTRCTNVPRTESPNNRLPVSTAVIKMTAKLTRR
jgi:hypothetical protein